MEACSWHPSVLLLAAILCFSISEEWWDKEPPEKQENKLGFHPAKPNEKLHRSPTVLRVAFTGFFFTRLFSLNPWMICSRGAAFSRQKFQVGWTNEPIWWESSLQGSRAGYKTVILLLRLLCQLLSQMSSVVCAIRC